MKAYKNILIATSLTPEEQVVTDKAVEIAKRANAQLNIVHIIEPSPFVIGSGEFALPLDGDLEEAIYTQAKEALNHEATRVGISEENTHLESGEVAEDIAQLVEKLNVDLLIVGSHEHHGLGFLFGSTSNAMLHSMPCDILAVRLHT